MDFIQLLSAAGIGGIVGSLMTALVQGWLTHRSYLIARSFQEKKEAYVGYLQALYDSEIQQTEQAARAVGHWRNRCELVSSAEVSSCMERMFNSNPNDGEVHPDRPLALRALKDAMRKDLSVYDV